MKSIAQRTVALLVFFLSVSALPAAADSAALPMSSPGGREKAEAWAEWAREQADALDPITTRRLDVSEPILERFAGRAVFTPVG